MYVKSSVTAGVYLRTLGLYCELNSTTPSQILVDSRKKTFDKKFTIFVRKMESMDKKGSYIIRFKKVLRSWLKFNDRIINFKVNIKEADQNPTTMNERIPTKEAFSTAIRKASTRGRVSRKRALVEHPFAVMKRIFHFSHTLVTLSRRIRVKFMFSCLAYNLFALNIMKGIAEAIPIIQENRNKT